MMFSVPKLATAILLNAVVLFGLTGCAGSGKPKYLARGKVTFDGVPVEDGHINFIPAQRDTAVEGGPIENGEFEFEATAGPKRVEIRASKMDPKLKNPRGEPVPVDYIPAKYNSQSTLTAEVTADGANQFNFELKSR
jgi:hypothetical protein